MSVNNLPILIDRIVASAIAAIAAYYARKGALDSFREDRTSTGPWAGLTPRIDAASLVFAWTVIGLILVIFFAAIWL